MVSANRDEFAQSLAEAATKLESHQTLDEARKAIDFSLNRHLLNFLGAMRFFLDHTQTRLTRHYGDDSPPLRSFKARAAQAYDTEFAYRFTYKLRNYAQHCAMPIGHVQIETKGGGSGQRDRSLVLGFDIGELLEQGDEVWGAPLKAELQALPVVLDVAPLVDTVLAELRAVSEAVEQSERPLLIPLAEAIVSLGQPVVDAGGRPVVGVAKDNKLEIVRLPYDVLSWLERAIPAVVV